MSCMQEMGEFDVCMQCGWVDHTPPAELNHLFPRTIVNGRYEIGVVIGFGGFGIIYRAWDHKLNMQVAIKEYFPSGSASRAPGKAEVFVFSGSRGAGYSEGLERFLAEARNMAKFSKHPNVVNVIDYFEENGTAYIVMEFLKGISLKEHLHRAGGKIPADQALVLIAPVLEALKAIHKEGIIHRDVSPDNIFLLDDGHVKLIDFGAARLNESKWTEIVLKPGYAPPEQYHEKSRQGPFTDVYAAGGTFYRMVTGILPEESTDRNIEDTLRPPSEYNVTVTDKMDTVVLKAMALNSDFRFQTVEEFEEALMGEKQVKLPEEEVVQTKRNRKFMTAGSAGMVLAAFVLVVAAVFFIPKAAVLPKQERLKPASLTVWVHAESISEPLYQAAQMAGEMMRKDFDSKGIAMEIQIEAVPEEELETRLKQADAQARPSLYCSAHLRADLDVENVSLKPLMQMLRKGDYLFLDRLNEWIPKQQYMPSGFVVPVVYYNQTLLDTYEVNLPKGRGELESVTESLKPVARYGIEALKVEPEVWSSVLTEEERGLLGDEALDEAGVAAGQLKTDQLAAYLAYTDQISKIREAIPGYYFVNPAPGTEEYPGRFRDVWSVVSSGDDNEDYAAMWFLSYMLSGAVQNYLYVQNSAAIPVNRNAYKEYMNVNGQDFKFLDEETDKMKFVSD